ncbi:MAG: hypothetical protein ABIF17_01395 [Patescibacteria group bacterium]
MFKKKIIASYILLLVFFVFLNSVRAMQYAPTTKHPEPQISTGVSSQVLDSFANQKLENYIPVESQKQIQKLINWGADWQRFVKIIIIASVFLLFISLVIERRMVKEKIKNKKNK